MDKKRTGYINWDQYFIGVASLAAMRSKDPNSQIGACIVSKDNRILSIGYNGAPNGFPDENFPWGREGNPLETKYLFVCHAEMNAIMNFRGNSRDLEGSKIYLNKLFPCNECAKLIIQSGIKEVYYISDPYENTDSVIASKKLMDTCGIKYYKIKPSKTISFEV